MKYKKPFVLAVLAAAMLAAMQMTALGQTNDGKIANMVISGGSIRWEIGVSNAGGTLTVTFPDGRAMRKAFRAGSSPEINLGDKQMEGLPEGVYTYDLQLTPTLTPSQKEEIAKARGKDDDAESERMMRKRPAVPSLNQTGAFTISGGTIIGPGAIEGQRSAAKATETRPVSASASRMPVSGNTVSRLRNHRASLAPLFDFVINDDLIVIGSACVGLDCVDGEAFNFDTIRMKENNTRILFLDTSTSAGFPTNDWIIRANSSASGGASFLAFVDHGNAGTGAETGTIVFQVTAGAPANSVNVASSGKVGFRTSTPVLDLHMNTSDTPAARFEQNNSGGFTAQTWDVAGNEANFFVRDVTSGSRLPFRIRPGAPTSSLDISATGNVGIGTASPGFHFHIFGSGIQTSAIESTTNGNNAQIQFIGKTSGGTAQSWLIGENLATTAGNFEIYDNTAAQNRFFINTAGNVGIGTTAPDQKFSVNGDASKTGGATWQAFSDVRLKNIKGNYNSGLKAVMQLQPLRYKFKPDNALGLKSEKEQIGFSAQDLQKVIPEAVSETASGYLMVNSDPILWTMLNAIKEQQKEIQQLKGEIQKLRKSSNRRHK